VPMINDVDGGVFQPSPLGYSGLKPSPPCSRSLATRHRMWRRG
jgi:hypothetical protein